MYINDGIAGLPRRPHSANDTSNLTSLLAHQRIERKINYRRRRMSPTLVLICHWCLNCTTFGQLIFMNIMLLPNMA